MTEPIGVKDMELIKESLAYEVPFEREESYQLKIELGHLPYEKTEWEDKWIPEAYLPLSS